MFWKNGLGATKIRHVLAGKKAIHSQVAHGDISLENALLGPDGEVQGGCSRQALVRNSDFWAIKLVEDVDL